MALAKQLETIQATSAYIYQRPKAPPSILFDNKISRQLDTQQILHLAAEGLETLRNLDQRFCRFEHSIFSLLHPIDRNCKSEEDNKSIDKEIREFCLLASPYFLLRATHKCLEWLIRGLEAGKRNMDELMALALPFHATPQFVRLLSVCELEATQWVFLKPVCQHKEPLQRSSLRNQAPLWLWRFVTQTAKDCAQRSVRAFQLYSFWAVFVREKLIIHAEKDDIIMKNILLDTLEGIQMRQGDWDSLLEYRNACVIVLCSFFQLQLNPDILLACVEALCRSFGSVCSLQNITRAVYPSEENMFYQLLKSLVKCLMLLFLSHYDIHRQEEQSIGLSAESVAQLCNHETNFQRILRELVREMGTEYSMPFLYVVSVAIIEQLTTNMDFFETLCQLFTLSRPESLRHLIRKLLESFERQLELCCEQSLQETNHSSISCTNGRSKVLQHFRIVMSRLNKMGNTEELDLGIREYLRLSKNEKIRKEIMEILVSVLNGSTLVPVVIHPQDMETESNSKQSIAETLLGALEHPQVTIREHAVKWIRQHSSWIAESFGKQDQENALRHLSEVLIRRIDMEDCVQMIEAVLDLFIEHVELQSCVGTLLFWSVERRLERMWKQVEDMDKPITLQLLQKLPMLQVDETNYGMPSLLGNFIAFMLHPEIDLDVKRAAWNCWMTFWWRETTDLKMHAADQSNNTSFIVEVLIDWMTTGVNSKESMCIVNIVEKIMRDCLDILSDGKQRKKKMVFYQLLFISVALIVMLCTEVESDNSIWKNKVCSLVNSVIESISMWIVSKHSRNKPLGDIFVHAWKDDKYWKDPSFLQKLFSDTNDSYLFFVGMSLLKQLFRSVDNDCAVIAIPKRAQLLATILFPLENCKWNWSAIDQKMIDECMCELSKSNRQENIVHLLFDNELSFRPFWIASYFLALGDFDYLTMTICFVLSQQFPCARPAVENVWKSMLNDMSNEKRELAKVLYHSNITDATSSSVPLSGVLSNDIKVAMLRSCLEMKCLSNLHLQLLTLLAPVDEEETVSLELLETVVQLLQWLRNDSHTSCTKEMLQDIYLLIAPYFTLVEKNSTTSQETEEAIWNVFMSLLSKDMDTRTRVSFLKRWRFVVCFGNQKRLEELVDFLFQLYMEQDESMLLEARQLMFHLAELDISLFLTRVEEMVKDSQSAWREDLPKYISRSIPLLELFVNVPMHVLLDQDDLSQLVKSLTLYLPLLSPLLEASQSSVSSYAQGLVVSILCRLCKYFGKRFPIGSLNLKIFTQNEASWEVAFSRCALIRLICYLTELFPMEMRRSFINAFKWMLRMTNRDYVVSNLSYIIPAVVAILSQETDEDRIIVAFISELLSFLDSENGLFLATSIFEALGRTKLETILLSYLLLRDSSQVESRNMPTCWEPYKTLLFSFPLTIQIRLVEQFLQTREISSNEENYRSSLALVCCITQSPMFRSWQDDRTAAAAAASKDSKEEEYSLEKLCISLLSTVFLLTVQSQSRMEIFQQEYASQLLCLFPFSLFIGALKSLLKMESDAVRYLSFTCLSQLLYQQDWEQTKHPTWYGTVESIKQSICSQLLPDIMENVISMQGKEHQLRIASIAALDVCVQLHPRDNLCLSKLSPALEPLMKCCCESRKTLASSSMLCLSTIVRRLGISCVEYVPQLLQVVTTVWEQCCTMANRKKQNVKQQTYIRAVIILVSGFQKHWSRFWSVSCVSSMLKCCSSSCKSVFAQQLRDQLQSLMSQLGAHIIMPILDMGLEDISIQRIYFLLSCIEKWLNNISNKEFRAHQHDIFSFLLKALDTRRKSTAMGLLLESEEMAELDKKIGQVFTKQALRLMESDFKVLFMRLVGWCEEEFSSSHLLIPYHWDDLCPFRCCYERLASFLQVVCALAQGLRELFLPYFSYLLDWCLWVASYPSLKGYWKEMKSNNTDWKIYKRKKEWQCADSKHILGYCKSLEQRVVQEAVNAIREYLILAPNNELSQSLFDNILHLLENRLQPNASIVDANILADMVSLFAEKIAKQVSSSSENTGKEDEVDSERRLASLNRFLFIKCSREEDQRVKQVSMVCVEQMIHRLGHRFLTLLPETLPLLSECLEDETIEEKAMQVVEYLEDLSVSTSLVMAASTCLHRLSQELKRLQKDPPEYIHVAPCCNNFLTWYFVLEGPPGTCYEGGVYFGKLVFPKEFPYKPPAIYLHTPNGRLQTDTRLCLSISDFHPETWNPLWSTAAVLNGLLSIMVSDEPSMNTLKTSVQEKRRLALLSHGFNAQSKIFCQLFPEWVRKDSEQLATLLEKQSRAEPRIENPISKVVWTVSLLIFLGFVLCYLIVLFE